MRMQKVAVLGAGVMGGGIAAHPANCGVSMCIGGGMGAAAVFERA
jgi:3-hydroxyacyl-CoA dehydrogenase